MPIEVFSRIKDGELGVINEARSYCKIRFAGKKKPLDFTINKLWKKDTSNDFIFQDLLERSQQYNDSYWCMFGYTGSGKTYTTEGLLKNILQYYQIQPVSFDISAFQIYNEKVYDLMLNNNEVKFWKTDTLHLDNIHKQKVVNIENILETLKKNRTQAATNMNHQSSRSHAFYRIHLGIKTITLVDMAGQENGNTNMKNGKALQKEGTKINLNMLVVKECIRAMHSKKPYIPFRRCLLTLALKPMFFTKCYSAFICTISGEHDKYYQMDSIRFASALYKQNDDENDKAYFSLFEDYNKYLMDMSNITIDEYAQWKQMKFGNFNRCKRMNDLITYKLKKIKEFNVKYEKYKKKLPNI